MYLIVDLKGDFPNRRLLTFHSSIGLTALQRSHVLLRDSCEHRPPSTPRFLLLACLSIHKPTQNKIIVNILNKEILNLTETIPQHINS